MGLQYAILNLEGGRQRRFLHRNTPADRGVIQQVFVRQNYALERLARGPDIQHAYESICGQGRTPLILDGGANIGASSVWLATRFPQAHIIAFEPEAANFDLLRRNAESLGICPRQQAVGATSQRISILDPGRGEWGYMTVPHAAGTAEMVAISEVVAAEVQAGRVPFLAKFDIEGGEKGLFEQATDWVALFPLLVVELHDWMLPGQGTALPFLRCISSLNRDFVHLGENIFSIANEAVECAPPAGPLSGG